MKKIHLLPNILTAMGLICGLFVIFKLNMTGVGAADVSVLKTAAGFLLLAGLFDLLDGALARALHVESEFGGLFDSLADTVTFGVAPSVIVLKSISADPGTFCSFLITTGALVYSMCGVLRLVRFSVTATLKPAHDDLDITYKTNFIGLPIPVGASAVVSLDFLLISPDFQQVVGFSDQTRTLILFISLVFLGYLMVSRFRFPSIKRLQTTVASFEVIFAVILSASLIFYGLIHHFAIVFFGISWGYILLSCSYSSYRMMRAKLRTWK